MRPVAACATSGADDKEGEWIGLGTDLFAAAPPVPASADGYRPRVCERVFSLAFTDGPEYVLTQRIHLAQNSEYTRTNDGVNVPCLTPSLLRPSLPLLLPLLLEVLLVRRLRVGVRVPLRVLAS